MDFTSQETVFQIPGEPAIVVKGLPPPPPTDANHFSSSETNDSEHRNKGFGHWLEGRKVQKLFGDELYNGQVTKYDEKMHWYKVVYEDGDSEELEWHELEEILLPLDITIPLKTLATKMAKRVQKPVQKHGETVVNNVNHS